MRFYYLFFPLFCIFLINIHTKATTTTATNSHTIHCFHYFRLLPLLYTTVKYTKQCTTVCLAYKDHHCPWQHVAIFVVVRRLMLLLCYFVLYDILVCCTLQHCIFKFQLLALSEVTISNLTKLLLYKLEPMVTSLVPTTN